MLRSDEQCKLLVALHLDPEHALLAVAPHCVLALKRNWPDLIVWKDGVRLLFEGKSHVQSNEWLARRDDQGFHVNSMTSNDHGLHPCT